MITVLFHLYFYLFPHPFHVSICEIDHDEKTNALQITHRIFLDDLEEGLNAFYNENLDLLNPKDPDKINRLVEDYLSSRFAVIVNGKVKKIDYLGNEMGKDVMWCYMEITKVKKLNTIEIEDKVLFETFDNQSNIIHVDYRNQIKSLRLVSNKSRDLITFE